MSFSHDAKSLVTISERQERRELSLAAQLSEMLSVCYPPGTTAVDHGQVHVWRQELEAALGETETADRGDKSSNRNRMSERIVRRAMQQYEAMLSQELAKDAASAAGTAQPPTSFSLFANLDPSFLLQSSIDWDSIAHRKDQLSASERLELLQRVEHVEDVSQDWELVSALLMDGWFAGLQETNTTTCRSYLELHRKWFQQCEHDNVMLQFQLCGNVLKAVRNYTHLLLSGESTSVSSSQQAQSKQVMESKNEHLWDMMCLWHDMWIRSQFPHHQAEELMYWVLLLLRSDLGVGHHTGPDMLWPRHCMAMLDPSALWFSRYIRSLSPETTLLLILKTGWLQGLGTLDPYSDIDDTSTRRQDIDTVRRQRLLQRALHRQSLSMIRSALACTRVVFFPWDKLGEAPTSIDSSILLSAEAPNLSTSSSSPYSKESSSGATIIAQQSPSVTQLLDMARLFLDMLLPSEDCVDIPTDVAIVSEAYETLLWGCLFDNREGLLNLFHLLDTSSKPPLEWRVKLLHMLLQLFRGSDWTDDDPVYHCLRDKTRSLRDGLEAKYLTEWSSEDAMAIDNL